VHCYACDTTSLRTAGDAGLFALAAAKFHNLTRAERALLEFADIGNIDRGKFAIAGSSDQSLDPSNDPAHADEWSHDRDVRAILIRWLATNPEARIRVDPKGIRMLGARIVGPLDLSNVRIFFDIALRHCFLPDTVDLNRAEISNLDLGGSRTSAIQAVEVNVHGDVSLNDGFEASAPVTFDGAIISGGFLCENGHFKYVSGSKSDFWESQKPALSLGGAHVDAAISLCCGFRSVGAVMMATAKMNGLFTYGGDFENPGRMTLSLDGATVNSYALIGNWEAFGHKWPGMISRGLVLFDQAKIAAWLRAEGAQFLGMPNEVHGFEALGMSVGGVMVWLDDNLENGAILDLRAASTQVFVDNRRSWPQPGKLQIGGFTYQGISDGYDARPSNARTRLEWLSLQPEYDPQPYQQLASVLRARGDDSGATQVMIASGDARYSQSGLSARFLGAFLKYTIGYGHRPLLAIVWSVMVMTLGCLVVLAGKRAGVMRLTWPENTPPPSQHQSRGLNPLLYSLDVFLPFVNLHQEHYWWPDADASGHVRLFGVPMNLSGAIVLYYLWAQIIAGWVLSAIFVAGVTGLIRND